MKRKTSRLVACLLIFVLGFGPLFSGGVKADSGGRTFYVDSINGDDSNDGTSELTPWKTFDNLNGIWLFPGDKILLKRGSYWNQQLILNGWGSEENPIEVSAYGTGPRPVIDGKGDVAFECLYWLNAGYSTVKNLTVMNAGAGVIIFGVDPQTAANNGATTGELTVEDVLAFNIRGRYIQKDINGNPLPDKFGNPATVYPHQEYSQGIAVFGSYDKQMTIRNCEVMGSNGGILAFMSSEPIIVENCYVHDTYWPGHPDFEQYTGMGGFSGAFAPFAMSNCVFDMTTFYTPTGTCAAAFHSYRTQELQDGVYVDTTKQSTIINTIFKNSADAGATDQCAIDFEDNFDNMVIDNCAFLYNAGPAIEFLSDTDFNTRIEIKNSKFYKNNRTKYHYTETEYPCEIMQINTHPSPPAHEKTTAYIHDNEWIPYDETFTNFIMGDGDISGIVASNNVVVSEFTNFNNHPYVDAGTGEWIVPGVTMQLNGSAIDDGGSCTATWEQVTGPAIVTFGNTSQPSTTVTFPKAGQYMLRLVATDGTYTVSSYITVTVPAVNNYGFEYPVISEAEQYCAQPSGSGWTWGSNTGIQRSFSGAPSAPEGEQTAYIQGAGSFEQDIVIPVDGIYGFSIMAAQPAGSSISIDVKLNGVTKLTFSPTAGGGFQKIYAAASSLTAGVYTLKIQSTGSGVIFVDDFTLIAYANILNNGFEEPVAVAPDYYKYFPTSSYWGWGPYGYGAGIQRYGSAFNAPPSPEGQQTAFLQSRAEMSQQIYIPVSGKYRFGFYAARRLYTSGGVVAAHLNDALVDVIFPSYSFEFYLTEPMYIEAGVCTIKLKNMGPNDASPGDVFIDSVSLFAELK